MSRLTAVGVGSLPSERFESVLDAGQYRRFRDAARRSRAVLDGRTVWNVNSTARGGGVAEMLVSLLAYARGLGVNARWEVIRGDPEFFAVTKRIHNHLHGAPGDGGPLGPAEREVYERTLAGNAGDLAERVRPSDVVILHDPQTAGLIPAMREIGAPTVWRCHVGVDLPDDLARGAWSFLLPYVEQADACVFSRRAFAWEGLDPTRIVLIAPSIDAFSPKNQDLDDGAVTAILGAAGLQETPSTAPPAFVRTDGSPDQVSRRAALHEGRPLRCRERYVLQVSRWDRLKDPLGVIRGFVEHVAPRTDAHLVYAGPAVEAVADDPEGAEVLAEAVSYHEGLARAARERVHLAALPMEDLQENAAIVNALQRRAEVIVQKSLAEGFGLTVAEGMWKGRPVVASRIGGIHDQIVDGVSGLLLDRPADLRAYGDAVVGLLADPDRAQAMGREAQGRVRREFLGVRSLMEYLALVERLLAAAS